MKPCTEQRDGPTQANRQMTGSDGMSQLWRNSPPSLQSLLNCRPSAVLDPPVPAPRVIFMWPLACAEPTGGSKESNTPPRFCSALGASYPEFFHLDRRLERQHSMADGVGDDSQKFFHGTGQKEGGGLQGRQSISHPAGLS